MGERPYSQGADCERIRLQSFAAIQDLFFYRSTDELRNLSLEQAGEREKKTGRADQKLFHGCRRFELKVWRVFLR